MKHEKFVQVRRNIVGYLKRYSFRLAILSLKNNIPMLLPYQYNTLRHYIYSAMLGYLFRRQYENITDINFDTYHLFLELPAYYEQPDKPVCINCKYNIININEKDLFKNEEQDI